MQMILTEDEARECIAFHVTRELDRRGKSRYWLAQQTGDWESTIANVCNGKSVPSAALLSRIATVLRISTDDLLKPIPKKFKKPENGA